VLRARLDVVPGPRRAWGAITMRRQPRYWGVVPAAGTGRRMGAAIPKQYLPLRGRIVLDWTLDRLCSHTRLDAVVVVLAPEDRLWLKSPFFAHPKICIAQGGQERAHSVLNGLTRLSDRANEEDWVLIHDAARPCLRHSDVDRLIHELHEHPVGGLLGVPVRDTVKRAAADGAVTATLDRGGLWRAFTPQMFRLGELTQALRTAIDSGIPLTDDASAIERRGRHPLLVEGHADNIKVTTPEDLASAAFFLCEQERERASRTGF
jgi:2-C-methyl-D-erythritol 4-phosphate cytidylyltransferase